MGPEGFEPPVLGIFVIGPKASSLLIWSRVFCQIKLWPPQTKEQERGIKRLMLASYVRIMQFEISELSATDLMHLVGLRSLSGGLGVGLSHYAMPRGIIQTDDGDVAIKAQSYGDGLDELMPSESRELLG